MKKIIVFMLAVLAFVNVSLGATSEELKVKATTCAACHGEGGISPNPLWPNLAGQKFDYIVKQLEAFHKGTRTDPMMNPMAANLSEEDIHQLAQYFSAMTINSH